MLNPTDYRMESTKLCSALRCPSVELIRDRQNGRANLETRTTMLKKSLGSYSEGQNFGYVDRVKDNVKISCNIAQDHRS